LFGGAEPADNRLRGDPVAPDAIPALLEQIDELLAEPAEEPASLARLERTLTDGYAHALALESERWRLEQRMSELAGELNEGNQELKSREMALLSDRLARNAGLLSGLRNELTRLRARTSAARRAR
jgi:ABC-type phosphate transport system auxiliary subunit